MSRGKEEEEKKKLVDKFFNYAEAPIKEWLSEYLGVETNEVFPDYNEDSDDIGVQFNKQQYNVYLLSMNASEPSMVDPKLMSDSEEIRKACSMLFDAVQMVMPSVVHTADSKFTESLKGHHCTFDEKTMSFSLIVVNTPEYKKTTAVQQYQQSINFKKMITEKLAEPGLNENIVLEINAKMKQVDGVLSEAKKAYEEVSEEDIIKEEARCAAIREKLNTANKLYIVVDKMDAADADDINESLKRLPVFGLTYEDTEDESFVNKLKKEYDLKG